MEAALNRQVQQNANPGDSTVNKKRICSRCCVVHQEGQGRWTLRLLAEQIVELGYVSVSHETVRQTLKKRTQAVVESVLGDSA